MISAKKIMAALIAAAITSLSCSAAVYAENDGGSITDDSAVGVPELEKDGTGIYSMKAGTWVQMPISLKVKTPGEFLYMRWKLSTDSADLKVDDSSRIVTNLEMGEQFSVTAPKTASEGEHNIKLTVDYYDRSGEIAGTQTFDYIMKVTSDLDLAGLVIESCKPSKDTIKPGDAFDLTVTLRNKTGIDIRDAELELVGLDQSKFVLDKGFTKQYVNIPDGKTGSVKFSLIAQNGIMYVRENLDLSLSYSLDSKKPDLARQVSTTVILKCQPNADKASAEFGIHDLTVTGYSINTPSVKDGTKFTLTLDLKNNSKNDLSGARVSVAADGSKFSLDSGLGYADINIKGGETKKVTFDLIGCPGISSIRETIPLTLEFAGNTTTANATIVCVPANERINEGAGKYDLTLTDYSVNVPAVAENSMFTLTLSLTNSGSKKIEKARVNVENLDGMKFAADSGLTYKDFDISSGETKQISFSLIGCSGISSVREVLPITINYGDISSTVYATIPCVPKTTDGTDENGEKVFAPNIIIESYEFGGEYVTAGKTFPLSITIKNTSSAAVIENLKVDISGSASPIDGSMAYSPANSSNSFFFERLGSKSTETINIDLLAKADAIPNSYPVQINFAYEYSVGKERFQAAGNTETVTIPLRQEDRLTINEPELPGWTVNVGEMVSLSTSVVNKGKSGVYNVTVTVEGDGFSAETPSYYIGNIASGSEEYYDAKLTPFIDGEISGDLIFTYEDANGEEKEKRIPFTFSAMSFNYDDMGGFDDGMYFDDGMMPDDAGQAEEGLPLWAWLLISGGAAVIIAVVVIIIVVAKKKKKAAEAEDDDEDL